MDELDASGEVSRILQAAEEGGIVDLGKLFPLVYENLRRIADRQMGHERVDHTLQTTALVNEVYLKLLGTEHLSWRSKAHFYGTAAEAMRRILIDHARRRGRAKRGGGRTALPLEAAELVRSGNVEDILSVDEAIEHLRAQDERMAEVVKLRFYAGLSTEETARALDVTERTVYRDWRFARAWLRRRLDDGTEPGSPAQGS